LRITRAISGQETGRRIQRSLELMDLITQDSEAMRNGRGNGIGVTGDAVH
jgi:hypothetical protein